MIFIAWFYLISFYMPADFGRCAPDYLLSFAKAVVFSQTSR